MNRRARALTLTGVNLNAEDWRVTAALLAGMLWLVAGTISVAQDVDCSDVSILPQIEMTYCANHAYEAADGDLNLAYRLARDAAREMDRLTPGLDPSNEVLLRDAQRAWIPFRDAACTAESTLARGGSMQSQLYLTCMERLTRQRTEDLRWFGEVN